MHDGCLSWTLTGSYQPEADVEALEPIAQPPAELIVRAAHSQHLHGMAPTVNFSNLIQVGDPKVFHWKLVMQDLAYSITQPQLRCINRGPLERRKGSHTLTVL